MKQAIFLAVSIAVYLAGAAFGAESCDMPRPGNWILETGQTTTLFGPGGGPDAGQFMLEVQGCGEALVLKNFPPAEIGVVKTMARGDDGRYAYAVDYRGYPVSVHLEMVDPENLTGVWNFAGAASAPGVARFLGSSTALERDQRCECEQFVQQLRDTIESNNYYLWLYSNPLLFNAPESLREGAKWSSDHMEQVVNSSPESNAEIKAGTNAVATRGVRPPAVQSGTPTGSGSQAGIPVESPGFVTLAETDCVTCKITPPDHGNACAADVMNASSMAHEAVHADACLKQNEVFDGWSAFSDDPEPQRYCGASNVARDLAAEEVRAYKAANAYIQTWYQAQCGGKL